MGSKLFEDNPGFDSLVWPSFFKIAFSITDDFLDILKNNIDGSSINTIIAKDILKNSGDSDYYNGLEENLLNNEYVEGESLFFFPYDWRLDLGGVATNLMHRIEDIKSQTGAQKVDVVSHSMGGLLLKEYF